jgi:hypothetical protein
LDSIIKSPIEKFPIHFNFSVDLLVGETLALAVVTCVNSATGISSKSTIVSSESVLQQEVVIVVEAGTEGNEHSIQCSVMSGLGNDFQRDLLLVIQTVIDDSFDKQPSEAFMYEVDFANRLETGDTAISAATLATKESDGSDVSATVTPAMNEVLTPKVGVPVAAGTDGKTYLLGTRATTLAGYVYEKNIRMTVKEIP